MTVAENASHSWEGVLNNFPDNRLAVPHKAAGSAGGAALDYRTNCGITSVPFPISSVLIDIPHTPHTVLLMPRAPGPVYQRPAGIM